jgi:palmitoyltransferase
MAIMVPGDSLGRAHNNEGDGKEKKKKNGVVRRRFTVPLLNRFRMFSFAVPTRGRLFDCVMTAVTAFADGFIYLLGPVLVVVALGIVSFLSYTFFTVLWPMLMTPYGNVWSIPGLLHASFVIFVVGNILHNYYKCVTTSNKGPNYDTVVRELAEATNFVYPENPDELQNARREYEFKIIQRSRARRGLPPQSPPQRQAPAANAPSHSIDALGSQSPTTIMSGSSDANAKVFANGSTSTNPTMRTNDAQGGESAPPRQQQRRQQQPQQPFLPGWMLMGPQEWSFCPYSKQPKPPRSHYDHVTKILVLNMDHYCPWMFNTGTCDFLTLKELCLELFAAHML